MGKNCHYKFFWKGDELGHGGIGILIKEKWFESVLSISRVNPCIMMLKMQIEKSLVNFTCLYVPQVGLSNDDKLLTCISSLKDLEIHIIAEHFNGHVGKESVTFDTYYEGKGYVTRNHEGMSLLDLCNATDLTVSNTFSDKNQNKLITFSSADNSSEIDYIMVKRSFLKYDSDIKVISHEECVTQQKLLVADITVDGHSAKPRTVPSRRKVWKLRDLTVCKDYETFVNEKCAELFSNENPVDVNDAWNKVKTFLLNGVDQVCGWKK